MSDVAVYPMVVDVVVTPAIVEVSSQGLQGIQGPRGIPGLSGASYLHTQSTLATAWTINHNLGKRPSIEARNELGAVIEGDVTHNSINVAAIAFSIAIAGEAYCV